MPVGLFRDILHDPLPFIFGRIDFAIVLADANGHCTQIRSHTTNRVKNTVRIHSRTRLSKFTWDITRMD